MQGVTVVDLSNYLKNPSTEQSIQDCKTVVESFHKTSALIIKDPRVSFDDNKTFLNQMEKYFNLPVEQKQKDARPELAYQVGWTPEFVEVPRDHSKFIESIKEGQKPTDPKGKGDHKSRFFWRVGKVPEKSEFSLAIAEPVIPEGFPQWKNVMDTWARLMLSAVEIVAEMISIGLGLPKDTFSKLMEYGPHLLAPTGSDLYKFNQLKTVFAGFHYDLNFLTIHGKSRYPGLHVWLRSGEKIPVKVPDGCLLLQAGKQIELLTGGYIEAGFHEVVLTEATLNAIKKAKEEGRILWRVSSTLFSHIGYDESLKPLKKEWESEKYPDIKAGKQVQQELEAIKLSK